MSGILSVSKPRIESEEQHSEEVRRDQTPSREMADPSIRMLYEFYSIQTTKTPGSINATYLLNGVPRGSKDACVNGHQQGGDNTDMQSSPYMSSSVPHQEYQEEAAPSRSIVLANGEDLEGNIRMRLMGWAYFTASEMATAK